MRLKFILTSWCNEFSICFGLTNIWLDSKGIFHFGKSYLKLIPVKKLKNQKNPPLKSKTVPRLNDRHEKNYPNCDSHTLVSETHTQSTIVVIRMTTSSHLKGSIIWSQLQFLLSLSHVRIHTHTNTLIQSLSFVILRKKSRYKTVAQRIAAKFSTNLFQLFTENVVVFSTVERGQLRLHWKINKSRSFHSLTTLFSLSSPFVCLNATLPLSGVEISLSSAETMTAVICVRINRSDI